MIDAKEKEIGRLQNLISAKESECTYLQEEVRNLRNSELSPSSSMDDISQVVSNSKQIIMFQMKFSFVVLKQTRTGHGDKEQ